MASRKPAPPGGRKKTRTGLRSSRTTASKEEGQWESDRGDDLEGRSGPAEPAFDPSLTSLVRDFLTIQQRRDDELREELRGLQLTLQQLGRAASSAIDESPRMDLPTPAPRRRGSSTDGPRGSSTDGPRGRLDSDMDSAKAFRGKEPKMPAYQQGEDIENYLLRFERMARTWQWPETEWACRLVPLLTGKALEAYTAMDEELSNHYSDLKEALLLKFVSYVI